ncbi:MAG: hypothetical protein ACI9Z3_001264, partial [Roseivirga sp.]
WWNREEYVLAGDFLDEKQKKEFAQKQLEKERKKKEAQTN